MKKLLMGNEAIAYGAITAGVNFASGYPGTPSTEVLETVAKANDGEIYVEWSVNEKLALEVAAGAAYAGAYAMVTMKQVGLNVASDPLMSLAYVGIKGAMVIVVADDPGPISSQTEQDTRHFAEFSKLPVFDPSSTKEAYEMIGDAFEYSNKYKTPVIFRPTTRVCHSYASLELRENRRIIKPEGFEKSASWVIFPKLAYNNHIKIEERNAELSDVFSSYNGNFFQGKGKKGIATGGVSYSYIKEIYDENTARLFKVSTPFPFPEKLALEFLNGLDEVLVVEELDSVIEKALLIICGKYKLNVNIKGKLTGDIKIAGENTVETVEKAVNNFLGIDYEDIKTERLPILPVRPPVLCAGCPHRASFLAVKTALKGRKAIFSGDIGCYTLGNAMPLDMVDTCLCMGAGITIAQGLHRIEPDTVNVAFIGDSTFFHTGIQGVINAVYNQSDIMIIVLDNSTTAMTGGQPHPGTGKTMSGHISEKISIYKILKSIGVKNTEILDPFNFDNSVEIIKSYSEIKGVIAIIFKSPCINLKKSNKRAVIDYDKCKGCMKCVNSIGCPAITNDNGKVIINPSLCNGCTLCESVCSFKAITVKENEND